MSEKNELQIWTVEQPNDATMVYRVPSTRATLTVDSTGILIDGNFRNMNSDERNELPAVMAAALATHRDYQSAKAATRKDILSAQEEQDLKKVFQANTVATKKASS